MTVRELAGFETEQNANSLPVIDSGKSLIEPLFRIVDEAGEKQKQYENEVDLSTAEEGKNTEEMSKEDIVALKRSQMKPILEHPMARPEGVKEGESFLLNHGSYDDLFTESFRSPKPALRSLQLSQWNPPPPALRLKGHLLYLQASTLEGTTFHITSTTAGYFVSNNAGERFDPLPKKIRGKFYQSHSLFSLLMELSPAMVSQIENNSHNLAERESVALAKPTNAFLAAPWLVREENFENNNMPDLSRTQEFLSNKSKLDNSFVRDWNDDMQSTKEMPFQGEDITIQDKVLRERLMNKLAFDFSAAATKGAISVIQGDIPPLNPAEPVGAQIFLSNNIFYSFGVDGIGTFGSDGGDPAARYSVGKDLTGVNFVNSLNINDLCVLCTCVVDYCGRRVLCQGPVPGILRQNSQTNQIVYGGVENRDAVVKDLEFEPYLSCIADACHIKKHTVYDNKMENPVELVTPVDTKGLNGTDGRRYVLDLYRLSPLDLSFIEKYGDQNEETAPYPHRIPVLRFEAIDEWFRSSVRSEITAENVQSVDGKTEEEVEIERQKQEERYKVLAAKYRLNPDVGFDPDSIPENTREEYKKDQQEVREVCKFVEGTLIPNLVKDVLNFTQPTPLDGNQLTHVLHRRGINMRYLGELYSIIDKENNIQLSALKNLVLREVIVRSCKNLLNEELRAVPVDLAPHIVSHFFNCLFHKSLPSTEPQFEIPEALQRLYSCELRNLRPLTVSSLHQKVSQIALCKFRVDMGQSWIDNVTPGPLFREISLKMGLQWRARDFLRSQTNKDVAKQFCMADDLYNIVPVTKASTYRSHYADEALEVGRSTIFQNQKDVDVGKEFIYESLALHEQVYGFIHPEVARAYSQAASAFAEVQEMETARDLSRKAIIISERCCGIDNAEAIYYCLNLALFEHRVGNTVGALHIIEHSMKLWTLVFGDGHPDTLTTLINVGTMLQSLKDYKTSIAWLRESLGIASKLYGQESIHVGSLYYQISKLYILSQDYNEALNMVRKAYPIFLELLGAENETTKDSKSWLDQLVQAAVHNARLQKVSGLQRPVISQGNKEMKQPSSATSQTSPPMADKSVDEIVQYINGDTYNNKGKGNKKNKKKSRLQ